MAAPNIVGRNTPVGQPMRKGYQSLIAFEANQDVLFWEKGIKPPGMDGGEAIDATTMHNLIYRNMGPQALVTLTESTIRAAYTPNLYNDILSLINVETSVTIRFSIGVYLAFYGFLRSFDGDEMTEAAQPECNIQITATNWDPVNNVEAAPVVGTGTDV